jgi:hypothetical protein
MTLASADAPGGPDGGGSASGVGVHPRVDHGDDGSSLRSPVTSKLFHRHAMLHKSHERTNGRPTARWSRLEAGRSHDLGLKS